MPQESANVLLVYGQANRGEFVRDAMGAIFGGNMREVPSRCLDSDCVGDLLAASRFDLPDALPTRWLAELSEKMPEEAFLLVSQWPKGDPTCCRERFLSGQRDLLQHSTVGIEHVPELRLPAWRPPFVSETQLDGPLPLALIAESHLKAGYLYAFHGVSGLCCSGNDSDQRDWHWHASHTLTSLLTEQERARIALALQRSRAEADRLAAVSKVLTQLDKATADLVAADIAKVLRDDERAVLEAVHEITARLAEASLTANDGDGFREFFDSLGRPVEAAGSVVQA